MDLQVPPPLETQGCGLGAVRVRLGLSQTLGQNELHLKQPWKSFSSFQLLLQLAVFTVMQAVSAARTPLSTVWRRFWAFFTRISSDDLHPGVTAFTLKIEKKNYIIFNRAFSIHLNKTFQPGNDAQLVGDGEDLLHHETELHCTLCVQTEVGYHPDKVRHRLAACDHILGCSHKVLFILVGEGRTIVDDKTALETCILAECPLVDLTSIGPFFLKYWVM